MKVLVAAAAAGVALALRGWLEASMALTMLVWLPALFAMGVAAPRLLPDTWRAQLAGALRPYALALLVVASAGYGLWMLPIALDLSRMSASLGIARDLSVLASGFAAVIALRVSPWPMVLFFGGNMIWMSLTFGLLFVEAEARLCASYLLGDQRAAGIGLLAYGAALTVALLAWLARQAEQDGQGGQRQDRIR